VSREQGPGGRGALPNSLGCSLGVGPLPLLPFASAIRCHQKSTCNMQLGSRLGRGSSVGSLAPPRATPHPTAGRCGRVVCRASTSLAPLCSPCARLTFGWGSKPPSSSSRSVLAPVGSSRPGARTHCPFHRFFILEAAVFHSFISSHMPAYVF
jgi:hypothetical protein